MNISELFDTAIAGLEAQTEKSSTPGTDLCQYHGPHGTKCLFGHMMDAVPDTMNTETIGSNVILKLIRESSGVDLLDTLKAADLVALQDIHDVDWKVGYPFRPLIPGHLQLKIWGDVQ